jgi:hypothetical protein
MNGSTFVLIVAPTADGACPGPLIATSYDGQCTSYPSGHVAAILVTIGVEFLFNADRVLCPTMRLTSHHYGLTILIGRQLGRTCWSNNSSSSRPISPTMIDHTFLAGSQRSLRCRERWRCRCVNHYGIGR